MLNAAPALPAALSSPVLMVFLIEAGVLLAAAVGLGRLAGRCGLPAVAGELLAGVLLGPTLLGRVWPDAWSWLFPPDAARIHLVDAVGQLGVLLLVGLTGMSIDLGQARKVAGATAWISLLGLLVPLGLGVGLGLALPAAVRGDAGRGILALLVGVAMCVSAIPVIARTLLDLGLLSGPVGQRVMTAAVVDDVVGWILLSVVSGLATTGFRAGALAVTVGALAAVPVLAGACGAVLRPAWRWLEREAAPGAVLAASVGLIVLSGAGMAALGMEPILGGLLAGLLIGNSSHRDTRFTAWNGPLGTAVLWVLAPIFFATAGLRMDLAALARPGGLALAGLFVLVAIVGKFAGVYAGARIGRLGHWEGVALGAGLNARGVIQVIVATVGLRLGILTPELYTAIILTALLTSILAGPWLSYAVRRIPAGVPPEPGPTELVPEGRPDHGQPVHR